MARNVKVVKNLVEPETPEILAAAIISIGKAAKELFAVGGITDSGLVALLASMPGMSGVNKADIHLVLDNLSKLQGYYVRSAPKK